MEDKVTDALELTFEQLSDFLPAQNYICAGGLPRDILLGKPEQIKDIDIIMHKPIGMEQHVFTRHLGKLGYLPISGRTAYSKKDDHSNFIVYEHKDLIKRFGGVPVQLIQAKVEPRVFVAQTFDLGLCQAAVDSDGLFWASDYFKHDQKHKTLTLLVRDTITPYQIGYSIKEHIPRLQQKYPYPTVIDWDVTPGKEMLRNIV